MDAKTIDVFCKNGHLVFGKYRKVKSGFLMKCYVDMIAEDYAGVNGLANNTEVFCPVCKIRVGRIGMVHGRPAVIINHGGVKRVKT
jgi:hypothetical protein